MNTYRNLQYTITSSLNERTIHIKLVNNISYMCYEGNFDAVAFNLSFDIKEIYELVKKCFAAFVQNSFSDQLNDGFNLFLTLENSFMHLSFHCLVGGFLNIVFGLRLREKIMSNDAQLTMHFQRIEQKQREEYDNIMERMEVMEKILKTLGNAEICFTNPPSNHVEGICSYPITTKSIRIGDGNNRINQTSFEKIKHFYQLEELTLHACQWNNPHIHVSNANVKKLRVEYCDTFKDPDFINNFPNLQELHMEGPIPLNPQFVTILRSMKHNIRSFTFHGVTSLNNAEMQSYCIQHGIELSVK
jgi:hypothetical protein